MPRVPFWRSGNPVGDDVSENPWDTVLIVARDSNGRPVAKLFPGLCKVTGIAMLQIDAKKKPGDDGSAITVTGYQPGPFEISCKVWKSSQMDLLQDIHDLIWRTPNKRSRLSTLAFDISHPALDTIPISSAVVMGWGLPEDAEDGAKVVRIKLQESVRRSTKNQVKTVKPAPTVTHDLKFATPVAGVSKNAPPPPPSTETFSPNDPTFTPASGPF